MLTKIHTILALLLFVAVAVNAQNWTNKGVFPPIPPAADTVKGATHGVAVDPDGKVWVTNFYADDSLGTGASRISVHSIKIFMPNGTPASFSPIKIIKTGFAFDTLMGGDHRGMTTDNDGNILLVRSTKNDMFRINYKTGEGMNKASLSALGTSPTKPAVDADGDIYVGPVVGGGTNPIIIFDKDFNPLGNALDGAPGIARTMEVSSDGLTLYWIPFTLQETDVYHRTDKFSGFDTNKTVILKGLATESATWDPKRDWLWVSSNSEGNNNAHPDTVTSWMPNKWYAYDVTSGEIKDSIAWQLVYDGATLLPQKPRGIGFSPNGDTAYLGSFETNALPMLQYAVYTPVSVEKEDNSIVQNYKLFQNYPNPFNPVTEIKFSIAKEGMVTLKVYDVLGREVATLIDKQMGNGNYTVDFNASKLSSGTYIYQLNVNGVRISKKMTLLK